MPDSIGDGKQKGIDCSKPFRRAEADDGDRRRGGRVQISTEVRAKGSAPAESGRELWEWDEGRKSNLSSIDFMARQSIVDNAL